MPIKKSKKIEETKIVSSQCNCEKDLKNFLLINMPAMFDKTPEITGNLNSFVNEIIKITCK